VNSPANHKSIAVFMSVAAPSHSEVSFMYPIKHLISPDFLGQSVTSRMTSFNDFAVSLQLPLSTCKIYSLPKFAQDSGPGVPTLHTLMIAFNALTCASQVWPLPTPRYGFVEPPPLLHSTRPTSLVVTVDVIVVDPDVVCVDVAVVVVTIVEVCDDDAVVDCVVVMDELPVEVAVVVAVELTLDVPEEDAELVAVEVAVVDCELESVDVAVVDPDVVAVLETDVDAEVVAVVVTVVFRQLENEPAACLAMAAFKTCAISLQLFAPSTTNNLVNPWQVILSLYLASSVQCATNSDILDATKSHSAAEYPELPNCFGTRIYPNPSVSEQDMTPLVPPGHASIRSFAISICSAQSSSVVSTK